MRCSFESALVAEGVRDNGQHASGTWPRGDTASVENVGESCPLDTLARMLHAFFRQAGEVRRARLPERELHGLQSHAN
jgi:hypothetical protein